MTLEIEFLDLPNDLLVEIFQFCRILPLTLVCSKINEIIGQSSKLMKKIILKFQKEFDQNQFVYSRKYQSVLILRNWDQLLNKNFLEIFKMFNFKTLEIRECQLTLNNFIKCLEFAPNLENLIIDRMSMKSIDEGDHFCPPTLNNFKSLKFISSDREFLKCFKNSSLEKIEIMSYMQSPSDIINFLQN